jgi:hypothetical protein
MSNSFCTFSQSWADVPSVFQAAPCRPCWLFPHWRSVRCVCAERYKPWQVPQRTSRAGSEILPAGLRQGCIGASFLAMRNCSGRSVRHRPLRSACSIADSTSFPSPFPTRGRERTFDAMTVQPIITILTRHLGCATLVDTPAANSRTTPLHSPRLCEGDISP